MSSDAWHLDRHLFNRSDVLVIFLDMDPSLNLEDLALPAPLGPQVEGLPRTRYEIIRAALRSFWSQKERAASNLHRLSLALYGVWEDVVELLPITVSIHGAQLIDDALFRFLGEQSPKYDSSASPPPSATARGAEEAGGHNASSSTSFPFHSVSNTLKEIQADVNAKAGADSTYTVVQGLILLSRPSVPPVNAAPTLNSSTLASSESRSECLLDVICLSQLLQPSSAYNLVMQQKSTSSSTSGRNGSGTNAANTRPSRRSSGIAKTESEESGASRTSVDVPCTVIDPVAFTGIAHKGLAVGPSLTKLLCVHTPHAKAFLEQPLTRVDIPISKEAVAAAKLHHQSTPSSGAVTRRASGTAGTVADPDDFVRVRAVATVQRNSTFASPMDKRALGSDSPPQGSVAGSRLQSNCASPARTRHSSPHGLSPTSHAVHAREAVPNTFSEVGRQRSTASVTFGVGDAEETADSDASVVVRRAEATNGGGSHSPRGPRPPVDGDGPPSPHRFVAHKSAPPVIGSASKRPASSAQAALTTAASARALVASSGEAVSSASAGPSPPPVPRVRPQARVNTLMGDANAGPSAAKPPAMKAAAPVRSAATSKAVQPSGGRLPPRPLAGVAHASATSTLNQRLSKEP